MKEELTNIRRFTMGAVYTVNLISETLKKQAEELTMEELRAIFPALLNTIGKIRERVADRRDRYAKRELNTIYKVVTGLLNTLNALMARMNTTGILTEENEQELMNQSFNAIHIATHSSRDQEKLFRAAADTLEILIRQTDIRAKSKLSAYEEKIIEVLKAGPADETSQLLNRDTFIRPLATEMMAPLRN